MNIRILRNPVVSLAMTVGLMAPVAANDVQPMDVLREKVAQGLVILNHHRNQGGENWALQEARLRQLSLSIFDFAAMSRMVLAARWHDFTSEQQAAFVRAFTHFLQGTYLPLLLDRYRGEQIEVIRQVRVSPAKARVEVRVVGDGKAVPVTVKMIRRGGLWKVYDLDALGFSAVGNYRAQFQWLLERETPAQVIERLENMQGPPAL